MIESMKISSLLSSFMLNELDGWNFQIFGENNLLCLTILHKNINQYCQPFPAHINGYFFQWYFSITADIFVGSCLSSRFKVEYFPLNLIL